VTGDAEAALLADAARLASAYRRTLPDRRAGAAAGVDDVRRRLNGRLPDHGSDPAQVLRELADAVDPGLVANGPRWFGFVDGGALPVAVAADWLTSAWDQNSGLVAASPAAAAVEEVVADWLCDLIGFPRDAGFGFVTGAQMANFTGLAAARGALLERVGWDVATDGLRGAPQLHVVTGEHAHASIFAALRMLGLGDTVKSVPGDDQGRMRPGELARVLDGCDGPTLVCALAGNVSTGAFDPFDAIVDLVAGHGQCWLHVDGAFGLWAATSPSLRHLVEGALRADSWTLDGHKWLNVPYDSGIAVVRDPAAQRSALSLSAPYLVRDPSAPHRDRTDYVPEASRRGRGFVLYATLRALGRSGIADLVERSCAHARRFAELLREGPGVVVLNDVVLNQVLVRFPGPDDEATERRTREVIARVQDDGTCWTGPTQWQGATAMRLSVVNWATTAEDVERSATAILAAAEASHAPAVR
jgi:glutamate/tyrosine decarboxylase-like PLP-dependent enzyme